MSTVSLHVNPIQKDQAVAQLLQPLDPFLKDPKIIELSIGHPCEVWTKSLEGWQLHSVPELTSSFCKRLLQPLLFIMGWFRKASIMCAYPADNVVQLCKHQLSSKALYPL